MRVRLESVLFRVSGQLNVVDLLISSVLGLLLVLRHQEQLLPLAHLILRLLFLVCELLVKHLRLERASLCGIGLLRLGQLLLLLLVHFASLNQIVMV